MKKLIVFASLFFFVIAFLNAEEPKYTNKSFARLSYLSGNIYLQRASDLGYEEATVNMPVSEGDRIGTTDGRVEVYLPNRNYLRLDQNTKVDFLDLPKKDYELTRIRIWTGNIYLNVNQLEKEKNIEIHTSDASLYVLDEGLYRVDLKENGESQIFVLSGLLEVAGEEGSTLLKAEQQIEVVAGRFASKPSRFYDVAEDSFDRWSEFRDSQIKKTVAKTYLPEELRDFEGELAENGEWVYSDEFGRNVWVPRGVAADWRPYSYGRWLWYPISGWTWLPYEPWGWAPFHFGRWHWGLGLGWYWIPTPMWGPAWVNWWWDYDYFAWAPMSYWGYPVVVLDNHFYGRHYGDYYPYNSRALTVIHKNQLKARNVSEVALSQNSIKGLNKIQLSSQSLPMRPVGSKVAVESLDGKRVMLRKDERPMELAPDRRLEKGSVRSPDRPERAIQAPDSKTAGKETQRPNNPPERKIRKKDGEASAALGSENRSTISRNSFGYPSSPNISTRRFSGERKISRPSSFIDRFYRYFRENPSSRGSSSRGSISRAPSSYSRPSYSGMGRSSGSVSSGPPPSSGHSSGHSGTIRKKD